jgi:hypothetical protein
MLPSSKGDDMRHFLIGAMALTLTLALADSTFAGGRSNTSGSRFTGHQPTWRQHETSRDHKFRHYGRFGGRDSHYLERNYRDFSYRCWYPRYGCYLYYNTFDTCWYYYTPVYTCYLPVTIIETVAPARETVVDIKVGPAPAGVALPPGAVAAPPG